MNQSNATALDVVNEQAEDEGLWFFSHSCSEAYLQAALRRLHSAVEHDARRLKAEIDEKQ